MVLEEQRFIHEDLERLEQAIADRFLDDPKHIRDRLARDHQIANFLSRLHKQTKTLLAIYKDADNARDREIQAMSTGDSFAEFYKQYSDIKDFHKRYPNEPVENLERAYKRRAVGDEHPVAVEVDHMFTGEEGYGRFFDLTRLHELYLNLPGVKGTRRMTYLQYLDAFDSFIPPHCAVRKPDKMTDTYFQYVGALASYLEGFLRKIRPLEDLDKLLSSFDQEFDTAWATDQVAGWGPDSGIDPAAQDKAETSIWCDTCQRHFSNPNVYSSHLSQRKHIKALQAAKTNGTTNGTTSSAVSIQKLKHKAVAEREFRIKKLASAMQTERSDTRVNVERKQGMTDRERQQELAALMADDDEYNAGIKDDSDSDNDEKIYNPLKLPLAWDGKPIPFWLYKLHGLGVEYPCEICGNFVYMGRRAFDKHFNESRHVYGLKCLGITSSPLFREITGIHDAQNLWTKIQADKRKEKAATDNVVQMEDAEGNVMPEKVYNDLRKQGLL